MSKSIVRLNSEEDPAYCPYCLRCRGLVRMVLVEPFYWRCRCGAEHDERDELQGPPEEIGTGLYRLVDGEIVGNEPDGPLGPWF